MVYAECSKLTEMFKVVLISMNNADLKWETMCIGLFLLTCSDLMATHGEAG